MTGPEVTAWPECDGTPNDLTIVKMLKSPISILQELAVKKHVGTPIWEISGSGEDHSKSFECNCKFNGECAVGKGSTKKDAKHDAALNMLKACGVQMDNTKELPSICLIPTKTKLAIPINYVGRLNEFCSGNKYPHAVYTEDPIITNNQFCLVCTFLDFTTSGYGSTKKDAKQDAAKNMLLLVKEKDLGPKFIVEDIKDAGPTDDAVKEALKAYTGLMANLSIGESVLTTTANINVEVPDGTPEDEFLKISNWAELVAYMNRKGWNHQVVVFNRQPLMLTLRLNEFTLINFGETQEEIYEKFVTEIKQMVKTNFDFDAPIFPLEA